MDLAGYGDVLSRGRDTVIKLNLSWTKYFPACSSQPWQVDGIVTKMLSDGFERRRPFWWEIGLLEDRIASGSRDAAQANGASAVPPLALVSV